MRRFLLFATIAAMAACSADDPSSADDPATASGEPEMPSMSAEEAAAEAALEAIVARYGDAEAAMADGFIRDPSGMCVTAEMVGLPASQGAMGVHYLHPQRLGFVPDAPRADGTDGAIVWDEPEVLVYEPQADGSQRLVAVEYLVFMEPWAAAGHAEAPSYFGTEFVAMADDPGTEQDEAHGFESHYELHVWTPRENPLGRYAEFNPNVSCQHAPPMAEMN